MHNVTLYAHKDGGRVGLRVVITDAKNAASAGRLATYHAEEYGYTDITVASSRGLTTGPIIIDQWTE